MRQKGMELVNVLQANLKLQANFRSLRFIVSVFKSFPLFYFFKKALIKNAVFLAGDSWQIIESLKDEPKTTSDKKLFLEFAQALLHYSITQGKAYVTGKKGIDPITLVCTMLQALSGRF